MNKVLNDLSALRYNKHYRIWQPFMEKYDCQVIAEIGVRKGYNFHKMIKHTPKLAVAVDCWKDDTMPRNDKAYTQEQLDEQYEDFRKIYKNNPRVWVFREYSFDAVKRFPDNYFDLVYIDADHSYEGSIQDIKDWYPKVKKGKFLIGDDYKSHKTRTGVKFGVIEAVNEFARDNSLSFFVFPKYKWGIIK